MSHHFVEPFDIDDDQLVGLSAEMCFVLGVEWAAVRAALNAGDLGPFDVHAENAARLAAMVRRRRGLILSAAPNRDGWARLFVDRRGGD